MKVVLYARVSTAHHQQNPEVQLAELREFCAARGWRIVEEIIDHGFSGGTGADKRPGLKRLLGLARSRKTDIVAVCKLDRLFRSLRHLVTTLDEFESLGVQLVSVRDAVDLTTPAGRLLVGILGALAQFEKDLARDRTLAGLAYARSKGKRLGRPPVHCQDEIRRLRAAGHSYREIARRLGVPMGVICRALQAAPKTPPETTGEGRKIAGGE